MGRVLLKLKKSPDLITSDVALGLVISGQYLEASKKPFRYLKTIETLRTTCQELAQGFLDGNFGNHDFSTEGRYDNYY